MGGTTRVEGGSRNPKFPYRHHCRRWIYDPPVATILILYHQSLLVLLPPCSLELPRPLYLSAILASSASVSKSFNDTHAHPIALPRRGVPPLALRFYPLSLMFHPPELPRPEEGLTPLHASLQVFEAGVKMLGYLPSSAQKFGQ